MNSRPIYFRPYPRSLVLVDLGEVAPHDGIDWFGVTSAGQFFPIIRAAELDV